MKIKRNPVRIIHSIKNNNLITISTANKCSNQSPFQYDNARSERIGKHGTWNMDQ